MAFNKTFENDQIVSRQTSDGRFECLICPHSCKLRNNQKGVCKARVAKDKVVLDAYGKITHIAIEPIEKKPIYHYKPNLKTLSVGGFGCSFNCSYCQNWMVSQVDKSDSSKDLSPKDIVNLALEKECKAVCFTYNEPIVYYEYVMDLGLECRKNNLDVILKTNAYANHNIWEDLCSVTSAMNIDWKGDEERYSKFGVKNSNVILDCISYAISKLHVEISVPVYYNTTKSEHENLVSFIKDHPFVPIHLLKIYPAYKDIGGQVTSDIILDKIRSLYLSKYVYLHNVYNKKGLQDTRCHVCDSLLASRESLVTVVNKDHCCDCTIIQL